MNRKALDVNKKTTRQIIRQILIQICLHADASWVFPVTLVNYIQKYTFFGKDMNFTEIYSLITCKYNRWKIVHHKVNWRLAAFLTYVIQCHSYRNIWKRESPFKTTELGTKLVKGKSFIQWDSGSFCWDLWDREKNRCSIKW